MSEDGVLHRRTAIAVVGMAGRFPGAADVEEFWRNLRDGVESVTFFSDEELAASGVDAETWSRPDYVRARAPLDGVELFDAARFGISPREAEMMDPQQRLFLECALAALESAGYDPQRYDGAVGVFAGANISTYLGILYSNPERIRAFGTYNTVLANDKDYLTTRVAYKLNLRGPAVTVQTACSTSLVAVHLACQSLLNGECDVALAGGVGLSLPERAGYTYEPQGIASPDGHCRAYDADARGTVSGSGVGAVVLRRLAAARDEGDPILAVIRGTAINNDGSQKVSFTAPSVGAQARVVAEALAVSGVDPETIGFVEGHGTGTTLGDPVEVAALTRAFRRSTARRGFCALGSVKTNIGHLDSAAGVAGLIKAVQALRHGEVPPTLHFRTPNPQIDFAASPFFVNSSRIDWPSTGHPRRAGVTSLGIGGTNAHLVLEEAPERPPSGPSRPAQLLVLSAYTESALDAVTDAAADYLRRRPQANLADVAHTYQVGRAVLPYRRALVAGDAAAAAAALESRSPRLSTLLCEARERPVCFLFSGQGSQYPGMSAGLYAAEPTFRDEIDRCAEILAEPLGTDIRAVLLGRPGAPDLASTALAQPALFTVEYALARLWMEWGVRPRAMLGHSVGEYVAACLAGVFPLPAALRLVAARGRLMASLPPGAMLAVPLAAADLGARLPQGVALAAVNGPALSVVAGPDEAVEALRRELAADGVEARRLHTAHAFHTGAVEPILDDLAAEVRRAEPAAGGLEIPYVADVTGTWQTAEAAADPDYWVRHTRRPVLFGLGLETLLAEPEALLLEVGPGDALASLARRHPARRPEQQVLASMRHPRSEAADPEVLLGALGQLWLAGVEVDWKGFYRHEHRHRLTLPTYPFERRRYWVERGRASPAVESGGDPLARKAAVGDWLYVPEWRRSPIETAAAGEPSPPRRWLLLLDGPGLGEELSRQLAAAGQEVMTVRPGEGWERPDERSFTVDPGRAEDLARLVDELASAGALPDCLVHLWSLGGPAAPVARDRESPWFYSLLSLAGALGRASASHPIEITVVTDRTQEVGGDEVLDPGKAALLGPVKVIPQEYPDLRCRLVDLVLPDGAGTPLPLLARRLAAEIERDDETTVVAHRGAWRWVQSFRRLDPGPSDRAGDALRQGGVYLITGGLGRIGLELAADLARSAGARLALLGRGPLPPREEWEGWLAAHDEDDPTRRKLLAVQALEEAGAEVLVLAADVADRAALAAAVAATRQRFGALHGVFHAAGSLPEGALSPIQDLVADRCAALFAPKLGGLAALTDVLQGEPLDFLIAFSSLSAVLGGLGYAAYAAANACMDLLAHDIRRRGEIPCVAVDWDAWRFGDDEAQGGLGARLADLALSPPDGIAALKRILAAGNGPQVTVSTSDLQARIDQWQGLHSLRRRAGEDPGGPGRHARPGLTTPYAAPSTELEEVLVEIWQELLGVEQVGIHDNFFDLGGHSLLGIQFNARLRRTFEIDLPLRVLFDSPTVAQLAELVENALIGDIEDLSDEEAERLLQQEMAADGASASLT